MPHIPLELKMLVIRELSPSLRVFAARQVQDGNAACFRDLRAVCLVWPDTIAIIRKILFETISLRANDHDIDASLRNLCQALENDPNLPTFIRTLEFSHQGTDEELSLFIPTASRPLFLSFLSYIPKMQELESLRLDNMRCHEETSIQFFNDLVVLKESSMEQLILSNNAFSISAFYALFDHWDDSVLLDMVTIDTISFIPPSTKVMLDGMLLDLQEETWDWDDDDTWTEWKVNRPRTASSCSVILLDLVFSRVPVSGMLMLMDLLASYKWSPFKFADILEITVDDNPCSVMTATFVTRINNLIRRYFFSYISLNSFTDFEDAVGTPLFLAGLESGCVHLRLHDYFALIESDICLLEWYVESLVAVPLNSRLREFSLELDVLVPLDEEDLESQGVWGTLDAALSGENLQLETLIIDVFFKKFPSKALKLTQLRTWLMEVCFPRATAKYLMGKGEETRRRQISALRFWFGGRTVDA